MCTRGIFQLQKLRIWFCEQSGNSRCVRDFLKSEELKTFVKSNPQIDFQAIMRKNSHPFISSTYINGYEKTRIMKKSLKYCFNCEINVRKYNIIFSLKAGHRALRHSGRKVFSTRKSIQGGWRNNLWNYYPRHEMEYRPFIEEPQFGVKQVPNKKVIEQDLRIGDEARKFVKTKKYLFDDDY